MQYLATGYVLDDKPIPTTGAPVETPTMAIEQARYEKVKRSKYICLLAVGLEERFQLVLDNFVEWEIELLKQAQLFLLWQLEKRVETMQQRLALDRRLSNLLAAFRLYLDQTDHIVSKTFGEHSAELEAVKKFKNSLYDTCFGYRFLEALRNHVQHCGLPVQIIAYNSKFVEQNQKRGTQFSVAPHVALDVLEDNEGFKKSVLDEAKSHGKQIDLRLSTREYISCIVRLHDELRKVFSKKISDARDYYSIAVQEYSVINGHSVQFPKLQSCEDSGVVRENVELITEFFEVYDNLNRRNSNVRDISRFFVSNAI